MLIERLERFSEFALAPADLAQHARISSDDSEALIELQFFAAAAATEAEEWAQIALTAQIIRVTLDSWKHRLPFLRLPIGPLFPEAVISVTVAGQPFENFSLVKKNWPTLEFTDAVPDGLIVIEYRAGYGDAPESIPYDIRLAIMDQAACSFDARGAADTRQRSVSAHFSRVIGRLRGVSL